MKPNTLFGFEEGDHLEIPAGTVIVGGIGTVIRTYENSPLAFRAPCNGLYGKEDVRVIALHTSKYTARYADADCIAEQLVAEEIAYGEHMTA